MKWLWSSFSSSTTSRSQFSLIQPNMNQTLKIVSKSVLGHRFALCASCVWAWSTSSAPRCSSRGPTWWRSVWAGPWRASRSNTSCLTSVSPWWPLTCRLRYVCRPLYKNVTKPVIILFVLPLYKFSHFTRCFLEQFTISCVFLQGKFHHQTLLTL